MVGAAGTPQWRGVSQPDIIWDSDERTPSGERLINRLLALSIGITPVTFQHACYLLRSMWFKVPWSTGMYKFIHEKVIRLKVAILKVVKNT